MTHEATAADRIERLISDLKTLELKRDSAIEDAEFTGGCGHENCEDCERVNENLFRFEGGIERDDLVWAREQAAWLKMRAEDVPAEAVPAVDFDLFWGVDKEFSIEGKDAERAMMLLEQGFRDAWRATIARQTERRQAA